MNLRRLRAPTLGFALLGIVWLFLSPLARSEKGQGDKQKSTPDVRKELKELRAACEKLGEDNSKLADGLLVLSNKHKALKKDHENLLAKVQVDMGAANGKIGDVNTALTGKINELAKRPQVETSILQLGKLGGRGIHFREFPVPADTRAVCVWVQEAGGSKTGIFGEAMIETLSVAYLQEGNNKRCRVAFRVNYNPIEICAYVIRVY